jgi:hypothetical protein
MRYLMNVSACTNTRASWSDLNEATMYGPLTQVARIWNVNVSIRADIYRAEVNT